MIEKMLVFDMDGTIANLYNVNNWLEDIQAHNARPYRIAKPMYDMSALNAILIGLKNYGWRIAITSWLAKDSTKEYDAEVRKAKTEWLNHYNMPYDELHYYKYGRTKADATRNKSTYQILIDDNEQILQGWSLGSTINAREENVLDKLLELLIEEVDAR